MTTTKSRLPLIIVSACALTLCVGVVGTLAWLSDSTESVTNTFTIGDVAIELDETTGLEYTMVPGTAITKDPTITVSADSEDAWIFVKIEEADNLSSYLTYTVDDSWTALDGETGVYYQVLSASETDRTLSVLENDQVTVLDTVVNDGTEVSTALTFTAYAIQQTGFDSAADAWAQFE